MKSSIRKKNKKIVHTQISFEMICQSNPKEISRIEKFLHTIRKKLHLDDGTMYRLMVCCTEAVNNAIVHGNKSDPGKKVVIRCLADPHALIIKVKDEGVGFDATNLQDPRDEKNLLKESGRGVFLIRALMDKVTFRKMKSGSIVEMKVKLP